MPRHTNSNAECVRDNDKNPHSNFFIIRHHDIFQVKYCHLVYNAVTVYKSWSISVTVAKWDFFCNYNRHHFDNKELIINSNLLSTNSDGLFAGHSHYDGHHLKSQPIFVLLGREVTKWQPLLNKYIV